MPYKVVSDFEKAVAKYAGAKYGISVDSCTNALLLCMKYLEVDEVTIPNKTYVGVAQSVLNAGGRIKFSYDYWEGIYELKPYHIIDSARRFTKGMYIPFTYYCLSFHWSKHLAIGRGGMILTDDIDAMKWFKRARFDGRREGVHPRDDTFDIFGGHYYMTPELASSGLIRMASMPDHNEDLPNSDYPDLSLQKIFLPNTAEHQTGCI